MDERSERIAKRFERPLLVAAVLTIPVTALQLLPPEQPGTDIADVLNWLIWLAFLAEVVVMLVVVPSRGRWLREHPLEIAIVVLTPPFLVSIVQSVRVLRILRVLRLLRLAPLIRVLFSTEGLRYSALLALLTALAGGIAFASAENTSVANGVYWAIVTMTTVGYGNVAPTNTDAKIIAVVVMLVGIGFATLLIGAIAERFINRPAQDIELAEEDILKEIGEISARLQRLERTLNQRSSS
jgi:voltage-gated potassium channel